MNELNIRVTALSLALDAKAEKEEALALAKEIFEWLMEGVDNASAKVTELKSIN